MENLTTDEKIGKIIRYLRIKENLTQKQLADEVNIHEKHLSKIERGQKSITTSLLDKLVKYFDKPHVYFFDFSEAASDIDSDSVTSLLNSVDVKIRKNLVEIIKIFVKNN